MAILRDVTEVLRTTARLLAFQSVKPDLERLRPLYLAIGLLFAWIAGVGRYWDSPRAELWQQLGLGSVVYVCVMAFLLWAIAAPLRPRNWRYIDVVIFVALTSPPAFLYAVPVEMFMDMDRAAATNVIFLLVVATWRVVLLWLFLRRSAGLGPSEVLVATFLPLALIVTTLTQLNLEHVVFNVMSGIRQEEQSANDGAYAALFLITLISMLAFIPLLLGYFYLVVRKQPARDD